MKNENFRACKGIKDLTSLCFLTIIAPNSLKIVLDDRVLVVLIVYFSCYTRAYEFHLLVDKICLKDRHASLGSASNSLVVIKWHYTGQCFIYIIFHLKCNPNCNNICKH
jgi:hypothetical protein